jgi:hypothetical protein
VIDLEPTTGVEPVNLFLTKEALYLLSYVGPSCDGQYTASFKPSKSKKFGAGDEARTRDIQLGRLKLYQLSYSRLMSDRKAINIYPSDQTLRCVTTLFHYI